MVGITVAAMLTIRKMMKLKTNEQMNQTLKVKRVT